MNCLRAAPRCVCPLLAIIALGCRTNAQLPLPDAAREGGLTLLADPTSLLIRPGSSGRVRFVVLDETNSPVPDYPVQFTLSGIADDTMDVKLSSGSSLTDAHGETMVEIIVGVLVNIDRPVAISVNATSPGTEGARVDILVTTNAYKVEILPLAADDLLSPGPIVATELYFYDNTVCADLDLEDINSTRDHARPPVLVAANTFHPFEGVAAARSHAVVGFGLDAYGTRVIEGCVDVPGSALLESVTVRAILLMDRLIPSLVGTYQVLSDFDSPLDPALPALKEIRSAWQQWARCPLDPARIWLDCTLAALDDSSEGCVPVAGAIGALGNALLARRGTMAAPLPSTLAAPSDTPCHGATDNDGNRSLEAIVDALFDGDRNALQDAALATLPSEIAALFKSLRLTSRLEISRANDANSYWIKHTLLGLTFPSATVPEYFESQVLGLPVASPASALATFSSGNITIPPHAFVLRLGTSARYVFEATSLKARNAKTAAGMVNWVLGLAQRDDPSGTLRGCEALDATLCNEVQRPRHCIVDACNAGLWKMVDALQQPFDSLDGIDTDLTLWGSAPVVDLDANGQADALGMAGGVGGVVAGPGLWSASIDTRAGRFSPFGYWAATRIPSGP